MQVVAAAKLTTSLRIVGIRGDGYHLVDAEMVALDLADVLTIEPSATGVSVTYRGVGSDALTATVAGAGDDLVSRALRVADRHDVSVVIDKAIPAGAGLGGGSSDAAAILRWAGFDDLAAAGRLGADVPFCVVGGRARVRGIGEIVSPLPYEERTFTLLTPPFGCSTPAVYAAWDRLGGPIGDHGNDLEQAALVVEPRLAEWRDRLGGVAGSRPRLAGSGSTWFVEGSHPGEGRRVVRTVPPTIAPD